MIIAAYDKEWRLKAWVWGNACEAMVMILGGKLRLAITIVVFLILVAARPPYI